jgi:hypothetical protein
MCNSSGLARRRIVERALGQLSENYSRATVYGEKDQGAGATGGEKEREKK